MEAAVRAMLNKHEEASSGQLAEINVTEVRIDLPLDTKRFKYQLFCTDPKMRDIWLVESDKQLNKGVIEQCISD